MSLPLLLKCLVIQHHFSIAGEIGFVTTTHVRRRRVLVPAARLAPPPSKAVLRALQASDTTDISSSSSSDYADLQEVQEKQQTNQREPVIIPFVARKTIQTPPLPPNNKSLDEFFVSHKNLLFAAEATVQEVNDPSDELLESFQKESSLRRAEAGLIPTIDTSIILWTRVVKLLNPPMHCVGVTLHSSTFVGMQLLLLQDDDNHQNVELQMTLLDTTLDATGPGPLVSLFYKIMGRPNNNNSTKDDDHQEPAIQTIGFTRVSAKKSDDNNNNLIFVSTARLESRMRIPALLWKLIPMSKKRLEARGSATLQKAIEKDMDAALERLAKAYVKWIQEEDQDVMDPMILDAI